MAHRISIVFTLLAGQAGFGQQVISAAGERHTQPSGSISYTIGEPIISTVAGSEVLTQGFEQPWADISTATGEAGTNPIALYPNPTRHVLYLDLGRAPQGERYELLDLRGALIIQEGIRASTTAIDMQPYASGGYVLRVYDAQNGLPRSFKITVNH